MDQPHKKYPHVYAIVRWDPDMRDPENGITVTKVMTSEQAAAAEVERLNTLNSPKGCRYFAQVTRLVETAG